MTRKILVMIAVVMLVSTASPYAHHGMRDYRDDRIETVEGTLVKLDVRNPHSIIYVDSGDQQGKARWTIEWVGRLQLERQGVFERTVKPGDHLVITGYASQNPAEHRLKLRTVVRPADGWRWAGTFE
jgi:uncharacterized protein DUF6152